MIDELTGWRLGRSGTVVEFFRLGSVTMVLLIVASTLALVYGRSLCSLVAWLLSRREETAKKSDVKKKVVDPPVRGLEDAGGRRWARAEFYRTHPNFDHNCPPESDAAKGLIVTETYVLNSKGVDVFVKSWVLADEQLHGVVFLCHGYDDSVTLYAEGVARTLALAGYAVFGMDYPSFGMSEGLHDTSPTLMNLWTMSLNIIASSKAVRNWRGCRAFYSVSLWEELLP